ncbi:6-phosphogluconate dehydrogenase, decarboxylating [Pelomyxa schiedti]|nr:6-phosphogluconate dehydrogenase, decarboxylating [Pelomyxa schiedti]
MTTEPGGVVAQASSKGEGASDRIGVGDVAVAGLGVMGCNLALNILSRGYVVSVWNRSPDRTRAFMKRAGDVNAIVCWSPVMLKEVRLTAALCKSLKTPRKIIMMVVAGSPVDDLIKSLVGYLSPGDVLIDGGNSHFMDTEKRQEDLAKRGILFVGMGVSGGEDGALHGPSIMPGGSEKAWPLVSKILQDCAAVVTEDKSKPCCDWIGPGGAGHFVKMVHNGIEYGDMQLICEAYWLLKNVANLGNDEIADVFSEWNKGDLSSYLIEITALVLRVRDPQSNAYVVDSILDTAEQKGTGRWTVAAALEDNVPVTLIAEAVFARFVSALKAERVAASKLFPAPPPLQLLDKGKFVSNVRDALFASRLVSYAQGFSLMRSAATRYKWNLNYNTIANTWRGGCIIRSRLLSSISAAFCANPNLTSLLSDTGEPVSTESGTTSPPIGGLAGIISKCLEGWRSTVCHCVKAGIPSPAMQSALSFFDGYRSETLPANLLQAQRDFFGAHTFERASAPGKHQHFDWSKASVSDTSKFP